MKMGSFSDWRPALLFPHKMVYRYSRFQWNQQVFLLPEPWSRTYNLEAWKQSSKKLQGKCQRRPPAQEAGARAPPSEHSREKQSHAHIHVPSSNSKEGRSTETTNGRNAAKNKCSASARQLEQGPSTSTPPPTSPRGFTAHSAYTCLC